MFYRKTKKKYPPGFTLVEAMTLLFIFSIIVITFYQTISVGTRFIVAAKNRLGATSLASEKMEIIRNLEYKDIGTISGTVTGALSDYENVAENANHFRIHTTVIYEDDTFDGVYPDDTAWEDYKKVTVAASWNNDKESVVLVSMFTPDGLEVSNPGDGILRINVFSNQPGGTGIPNSTVHVVNNDTGLDTVLQTDSSGSIILTGDKITDSIQKYRISLSKTDYEDVSTMPPYPGTAYAPVDTDASVVTGSINVANIVQNKLASLKVKTIDYLDNPISNINFNIFGGRIIGNTVPVDPLDPTTEPIYNLDVDSVTNSSGEKDFGSVSPGQYYFSLDPSVTDYVLIDTDPASPVSLFSEQDMTIKAKLANKNATSLLVRIVSSVDGVTSVAGAEVELKNALGYDEIRTSSDSGTVFFPVSADVFVPEVYDLKITADGFSDHNSQVTITQDQLESKDITLNVL